MILQKSFGAQIIFLLLLVLKKVVLLNILVTPVIFCNIINVFTVMFDQFNASLLTKIIFVSEKEKTLLTPNFRIVCYK